MNAFWNWLLRDTKGNPSTKRVAYLFVVTFTMGLVYGVTIKSGALTPEAVTVINSLLLAVTTGYVGGRFAESKDAKSE